MSITITAKCKVKPGCDQKYLELARELVAKSRSEAGCQSYGLYQDAQDPSVYLFIEEWKDNEAVRLHNESDHFTRIIPQFEPLCSEPLAVNQYHPAE